MVKSKNLQLLTGLFIAVFSIKLVVTGTTSITSAMANLQTAHLAQKWPSTKAEVIKQALQRTTGKNSYWFPVYTYQYKVKGARHIGDRQSIGEQLHYQRSQDVQLNFKKHPVGSMLQIRYNPDNPAESTISISSDNGFSDYLGILIGILSVIFPFIIIYALVQITRRQTPNHSARPSH